MKQLVLVASLATLMTGCVVVPDQGRPTYGGPYQSGPVQQSQYRYVYYPEQQVYYSPETRNWFWMSGNAWQTGLYLPSGLRVDISNGVSVNLNSPRPYIQHAYVEEHYGRPWREQHRGPGFGPDHRGDHDDRDRPGPDRGDRNDRDRPGPGPGRW
jgi:hypothetical protein